MATQFKTVSKFIAATGVFGLAALGSVSTASAATTRIFNTTGFTSPIIRFDEPGTSISNPVYNLGGRQVSFSGTIDTDIANPSSPVLFSAPSGVPSRPINISFTGGGVSAVGFNAGFFNSSGSTTLTALGSTGNFLGSLSNSVGNGFELLALGTQSGLNEIFGLQIASTDGGDIAIDNFQFNVAPRNTNAQAVPEPFTIVGTIIGGSAAMRMRKKLKSNDKV